VPAECHSFIKEKVNYNGCVASHKNDSGFFKSEWRVYLGKNDELWKNKREMIILYDQQGKVIDQLSY
jgi:hypothetical protein